MSLLCLLLGGWRGKARCGDDDHGLSGLDVPEHVGEPEFLSRDNDDRCFWFSRLIGVHLFRFRLLDVAGCRRASPLSGLLGGHPSLRFLVFHQGKPAVPMHWRCNLSATAVQKPVRPCANIARREPGANITV